MSSSSSPLYRLLLSKSSGEDVNVIGEARSRVLTFLLNGIHTVQVGVTLRDPLAASMQPGFARLKVWRPPSVEQLAANPAATAQLIFYGFLPTTGLTLDTGQGDDDGLATATFSDPRYILARRYSLGTEAFAATDQGSILWSLVNTQNARSGGDTWLRQGATSTGVVRDRTYDIHQISDLFAQMTGVLDGPDVDVSAVDYRAVDGTPGMGLLNVYARQGVDRSATVAFLYGDGLATNVRSMQATPAELTTLSTHTGTGADGSALTASAGTPIPAPGGYGMLEAVAADPDVSDVATLGQKAAGDIAALGSLRYVVTIGETLEEAPRAFEDYYLGDTVRVMMRKGAAYVDQVARVQQIVLNLDEQGVEHTSVVVA